MTKPQLSEEMERRFDEFANECCLQWEGHSPSHMLGFADKNGLDDVKHFLATAIEAERKKILTEVEIVMNDNYLIRSNELDDVRGKTRAFVVAGIDLLYNFRKDVLDILNGKEKQS